MRADEAAQYELLTALIAMARLSKHHEYARRPIVRSCPVTA
jgi:hypothetical protein